MCATGALCGRTSSSPSDPTSPCREPLGPTARHPCPGPHVVPALYPEVPVPSAVPPHRPFHCPPLLSTAPHPVILPYPSPLPIHYPPRHTLCLPLVAHTPFHVPHPRPHPSPMSPQPTAQPPQANSSNPESLRPIPVTVFIDESRASGEALAGRDTERDRHTMECFEVCSDVWSAQTR